MRRVRVLHITPSVRLLGARRSLLTLVCSLAGTYIEPLVLAPAEGPFTEELDKRKLPWIQLRLPPWRKFGSWATMGEQIATLREICDREQIDLIHCNEIYPTPHALVASSAGGVYTEALKRIALGRSATAFERPVVTHMRLSVTPRMVDNYFLKDSTRIIAVSQGAAADFDGFPWKNDKVRVVHNGVELDEFDAARERRSLTRHRLGFADDDFVIGQIGLMMARKRPRFVIEAAPGILKRIPNAKFLFVGESSPGQETYLEELKQLATTLGVAQAIVWLPFQRRVVDFFAALDVNCLISNDEGFGRVVLEAAGAHVPTIGSNVGGIPELIRDGETGYLLGDKGSAGSDESFWTEMPRFEEIIAELAGAPERKKRMGDAAFELASSRFSVDQYVTGVAEVFNEALEEFY